MALYVILPAHAQDAVKEPTWDDIIKGPFQSVDRGTVQKWVDSQVRQLLTGQDTTAIQNMASGFYSKLTTRYQSREATKQFKDGLAEIVTESFNKHYQPSPESTKAPRPLGVSVILMVLRQFNSVTSLSGFRTALKDPTPGPRLVAAEGLIAIRDQLKDDQWTAVMEEVQKVAAAETNPVTLARLYRFLFSETANRADAASPVLINILDTRFAGFEKNLKQPAPADAEAALWLAKRAEKSNKADVRNAAILRLARLMDDAVDVYLNDLPKGDHQEQMERIVMTVEPQLETMVKAAAPTATLPKIRDLLLAAPGPDHDRKVSEALAAWTGSSKAPGVLNQSPFSLPVGLGIQRTARASSTTSAPASAPGGS